MDERQRLIGAVETAQAVAARFLLSDQLLPVLDSTLTMQQLKLMAVLYRDGATRGHELARLLGVSTPTVSGTVDRLVERGMIERRADSRDRRVRLMALTAAGEEMIITFQEAGWRMGQEVMSEMDLPGLRALAQGLAEVARAAQRRHAGAAGDAAHTVAPGGTEAAAADRRVER